MPPSRWFRAFSTRARPARVAISTSISSTNLSYLATWYLNTGHVQGREPRSAHPSLVPSQLYRTRDGYIFIMCNKEKFWPILCDKLGHPEWADDPRFATFGDRRDNRDAVNEQLDAVLSTRGTAEWLKIFAGIVPAAPVNDLRAALENPFVRERVGIRDYEHPTQGAVRMVSTPISWAGDMPRRAATPLGADTASVLSECGFSEREIQSFPGEGVI